MGRSSNWRSLRLAMLFLALALAVVGLAACGGGGSSSSAESSSGESATESESETASETEASGGGKIKVEPKSIGVLDITRQSPIQNKVGELIEEAAGDLGWSVDYVDCEANPQKVQTGMKTFLTKHLDGIILSAIEPESIAPLIAQAQREKVPVISVAGGMQPSGEELVDGAYTENELKLGQMVGEYMAEQTPEAKVLGLLTSLNYAGTQRSKGMEEKVVAGGGEVAATTEVDLTNPVVNSQKATTDMLTANPDATSVYGVFDNMAAAAIAGVKQKHSDAQVYTYYTTEANVEALQNGSLAAVADLNLAKTGAIAMDQLVGNLEKGTPINKNALKEDPLIYRMVSSENIEEVLEGGTEVFPNEETLAPFLAKWEKEYGTE